jgi:hypothetical protein
MPLSMGPMMDDDRTQVQSAVIRQPPSPPIFTRWAECVIECRKGIRAVVEGDLVLGRPRSKLSAVGQQACELRVVFPEAGTTVDDYSAGQAVLGAG